MVVRARAAGSAAARKARFVCVILVLLHSRLIKSRMMPFRLFIHRVLTDLRWPYPPLARRDWMSGWPELHRVTASNAGASRLLQGRDTGDKGFGRSRRAADRLDSG